MATRPIKAPTVGTVATNYPILKDKAVVTAAEEYATNKAEIDRLEALNKEHRKTIEAALAGAPIAYAGARIIRCSEVKALPATALRSRRSRRHRTLSSPRQWLARSSRARRARPDIPGSRSRNALPGSLFRHRRLLVGLRPGRHPNRCLLRNRAIRSPGPGEALARNTDL